MTDDERKKAEEAYEAALTSNQFSCLRATCAMMDAANAQQMINRMFLGQL